MQFDKIQPDARGALHRRYCRLLQALHLLHRQRVRLRPTGGQRHSRRRFGGPRAIIGFQGAATAPRPVCGSLAARVSQLHAQHNRRHAAHERHCARHRRLVGVAIKPRTLRRDAAFGHDASGLDHQHRRARQRHVAQMHQMPIGHRTVDGAVLAHGGDGNAVGQRVLADLQRRKQFAHDLPCEMQKI